MPVYMAETKFSTKKAGYSALSCVTATRCGVSSDLTEHMAHLVQAVVWTAGLDDRLADSGLIPF